MALPTKAATYVPQASRMVKDLGAAVRDVQADLKKYDELHDKLALQSSSNPEVEGQKERAKQEVGCGFWLSDDVSQTLII